MAPPTNHTKRWTKVRTSSGIAAPATRLAISGDTSGDRIVADRTAVRIRVGSTLSNMATAGADIIGGAAARIASPNTSPGWGLPGPITWTTPKPTAGGLK